MNGQAPNGTGSTGKVTKGEVSGQAANDEISGQSSSGVRSRDKALNRGLSGLYLGLDIGGTGIKGGLVDRNGRLLTHRSVRTPVEEGRSGIMRATIGLAASLLAEAEGRVSGIGVGSAGMIDPETGRVLYATDNLPGWAGHPLADSLSDATGLPVRANNDVNAAALGEAWVGAGQQIASFALVALGTGVGGAFVSAGKVMNGFNGAGAEFGHLLLKQDGIPCNCGQKGCFEQYASGTALNRMARSIHPEWNSRILLQRYGEREPRAVEAVNGFVNDLAAGLITVYHVLGPEVILLGGGLLDSADLWWERLEEALRRMTPKPVVIRKAHLGNQAGIIGAASLLRGVSVCRGGAL